MKKIIALVLALVLCFSLVACGGSSKDEAGSVYYLNFKPEADAAWQELAALYTEQTGVEVKVVTAASGKYETELAAEMDKGADAPTLFQMGNQGALKTWGDFAYDLSGTDFAKEMTTTDFNLYGENGELLAAGYCYEAYGIITNKALLKEAGYDVADIKDFASLKAIAEDIHARSAELGFDAFSASGLESSGNWRFSGHLTNMPLYYEFRDDGVTSQPATVTGKYLPELKNIWDLYVANSSTQGAALASSTLAASTGEFNTGKAVFYQNGSWEYAGLIEAGMKAEDLTMLPIYCGVEGEENAALCCGTENCWAVNKTASEADIQATLDFMKWVVTSEEGTTMMAEQFGPIPFKSAKTPENVFFADANNMIAEGKYVVTWAFNYTPAVNDWRTGIVDALTKYTAGTAEWTEVETAYIQGWANLYKVENAG